MIYTVTYFEENIKKIADISGRKNEIIRRLQSEGKIVISVKENFGNFLTKTPIKVKDLAGILKSLSDLIRSDNSLTSSLDTIRKSLYGKKDTKEMYRILTKISDNLREGNDLSTAMEDHIEIFGPTTISMIKAGESSGRLQESLSMASDYLLSVYELKREAGKKLAYPVVILVVAICAMLLNAMFIIPKLLKSSLFELAIEKGGQDSMFAIKLLQSSSLMIPLIIFAILGTIFIFYVLYKIRQKEIEKIIFKLKPLKTLVFYKNFYVAFFTLAKLIESGVRLDLALEIVHDSVNVYMLKKEFKNALARLKMGEEFFTEFSLVNDIEKAMLTAATDTQKIYENLELVADRYQKQYVEYVRSLAPKVYGFTMIFVAGVFIMMLLGIMLPYSQILSGVQ